MLSGHIDRMSVAVGHMGRAQLWGALSQLERERGNHECALLGAAVSARWLAQAPAPSCLRSEADAPMGSPWCSNARTSRHPCCAALQVLSYPCEAFAGCGAVEVAAEEGRSAMQMRWALS